VADFKQAAHAVVSPPESEHIQSEREYWKWYGKAAEIAQEKGFRGCLVVGHPWRVTDDAKRAYEAADTDVGLWVWLRRESDDISKHRYWSPHYHIVGPTTPDMGPAKESDGAVYKFIRSLDHYSGPRDGESHETTYGCIRYLLSHTGFPQGSTKQTSRWYGDLANSVFVENASAEYQTEKPSEGVQSVIKRTLEERVGVTADESDEKGARADESDDEGECASDGCDGRLIGVWDIQMYLDHNQPPPDVRKRMVAAYEWRAGDRVPPAGLKRPQTKEQAIEAFEALL
jgi:hypothetical protein